MGIIFSFVFFPVIFVGIFGLVIYVIAKSVKEHREEEALNDQSPVVTAPAKAVAKRSHVTGSDDSTSTHYYVTFEFQEGTRIEFTVEGEAFGMIAEGDTGNLTFQGTRYLGFVRR